MPRIVTYQNNVFPDAGPMADLAASSAKTGYYIGQMWEGGFNSLARGVRAVQSGMEEREKAARDLAEQEDVANLTVAYAMKNAEVAVRWKKAVGEADPNDTEFQQKFMQDISSEYNMIHEQAKTQKGRMYSVRARAEAVSSQFMSTSADVMALQGEAAVQSVNQIVDAYSRSASDDPGNVTAYHDQLDLALEAQITANGLDAKGALKLRNEAHAAIDKAAIEGMILNNPEGALKALDDNKFNTYLTGQEKVAYTKSANERIKAIASDEKAKITEAEKQAKQKAQNELIEIQKLITIDEKTGKATVPGNFFTMVDQWAKDNSGYVDAEDVRAVKNYAQTKINTKDVEDFGVAAAVDPQTYEDFTRRAKNGTLTKAMIYDAAADGLLTDKHLTFFNKWIDSPEGENKELTQFDNYLDGFKKIIVTSSMGVEDAAGLARYTDFNMDMKEQLPALKAAGMTRKQIDEYVRMNVERYQIKDVDEDRLDERMDELGVGAALPPNIDPLPVEQGRVPLGDILGKAESKASGRSIIGASRNPKLSDDAAKVLSGLLPEARPKFEQLVENLEARGVPVKLIEGKRSLERQAELYAQGRTTPGKKVTWTMNSKHLKGIAVDIVPVAVADARDWAPDDPVWDVVGEEAAKLGLKWGITSKPGEKDKPHLEWIG